MPTSQHWVFWSIFLPFCWISYCIIKSSSYSYNPLVLSKKIHFLILKNSDKKSTIVKPWGSKAMIRKGKHICKFLYKALFVSARLAISKKQNIFRYQITCFLKHWFLFSVSKNKKQIKTNLLLNLNEWQLQLCSQKIVSQIANEIFATQHCLSNHLKRKTINKTTCRIPLRNLRQVESQLGGKLSNCPALFFIFSFFYFFIYLFIYLEAFRISQSIFDKI